MANHDKVIIRRDPNGTQYVATNSTLDAPPSRRTQADEIRDQYINRQVCRNGVDGRVASYTSKSRRVIVQFDDGTTVEFTLSQLNDLLKHEYSCDGLLLRACPPAPAARFSNLRINLRDSAGT